MKKIFLTSILFFVCFSANSDNIKLDPNQANCTKVIGYGADDKMSIAAKYEVSLSSVKFIGTKWRKNHNGNEDCFFIFDTPKGPKECANFELLSDDNGKTAFGLLSINGNTLCK